MEVIRENGRVFSKSLQQITITYLSKQRFTSLAFQPDYADRLFAVQQEIVKTLDTFTEIEEESE
jgi:hypothetical protein